MENKEEFEKLQEESNNLRMKLAGLVIELTSKEQTKLFEIINEIVNIEIEQEKLCNF